MHCYYDFLNVLILELLLTNVNGSLYLLSVDIHRSIRDYPPHEPFEENAFVDVTVTHIENPHSIYVQRVSNMIKKFFLFLILPVLLQWFHITWIYIMSMSFVLVGLEYPQWTGASF